MTPITVLIADDHTIVREGLHALLERDPKFCVVGTAGDGRTAVEMALQLQPQIVLMDVAMPLLNGFEATRQIVSAAPAIKVFALTGHSNDDYVTQMVAAGASGYMLKQDSGQLLINALQEVARGQVFFSPSIDRRRNEAERKSKEDGTTGAKSAHLTPREAEVLQLVAEGATNKQSAVRLGISVKTIEKHRQQLMNKLNIHDTAGLTRHAISTGVIENSSQTTTV